MPARNPSAGDPAVERGRRSLATFLGEAGRAPTGFVGRARELEEVGAALQAARDSRGALLLLAGDPGIGKTRLAEEAEALGSRRGFGVAWGRCWEAGGAPAFWPWTQALRALDGELPVPVDEGAAARFALFDATTEELRRLSADRPLLIVLDDLHAADRPSLLLLQFVARSLHGMGVVVIGTYREAEARVDPATRAVLGELERDGALLPLRGLGQADVAAMLGDAGTAFAREVWRVTEGNPFFVDEIVRLHVAEAPLREGAPAAFRVPAGVRETIRRRLEPLPQGADAVLALASVAGREFTLELLAKASTLPTDRLAGALEAALQAELVREVPGATERYRFAHVLIRDALYERLEPAEREALHGRLARVLEQMAGEDPDAHVAQLAHHFARATPAGEAGKAMAFCVRAAEQAGGRLAYEDAVAHLEQALALAPDAGLDDARRCDLLLALGRARIGTGETAAAREAFAEAATAARQTDDGVRLAHAAVGFGSGGTSWADGSVDDALVALLEEAAASSAPGPALRATVLAKLADALVYARDWDRTDALTTEALDLARTSGDTRALIAAISARELAVFRPATLDERLVLADELIEVAEAHGGTDGLLAGFTWAITTRLERGDRTGVDDLAQRFERAARASRQPHQLWGSALHQAMLAILDGRIDAAERLAGAAVAGAQGAVPLAGQMFGVQLMAVRREQDRMAEVEPAMSATIANYPAVLSWRCAHAAVLARLGRVDQARAELRRVVADGLPLDPRDYEWPPTMGLLGPLAATLGETALVQRVYDDLAPWADRMIVVSGAVLCEGSVARTLGILAAVLGRWEEAEAHFGQALSAHEALGSALWSAHTRVDWARSLHLRGRPRDAERARALAGDALAVAERLGLPAIAAAARPLAGPDEPSAQAPPRARTTLLLRREGDVWAVGDPSAPVRLRHAKGLAYLAELVARPGIEIAALELAGAADAPRGDAGPGLDAAAKSAYRERLRDLADSLEEARDFGDDERAARARIEIETIEDELAGAVGLGGRDRPTASSAERARSSVTKALRGAITRIGEHDDALARYLDLTIATGTLCAYTPPPQGGLRFTM